MCVQLSSHVVRLVWLVTLINLFSHSGMAQADGNRPKNSITWGGCYLRQAPIKTESTGDPVRFSGWWTPGYSAFVQYDRKVSSTIELFAGLAYSVIPFSYAWDFRGTNSGPERVERWYIDNHSYYALRAGVGWSPFQRSVTVPFVAARAELLMVPSKQQVIYGYRSSASSLDTVLYGHSLVIADRGSIYGAFALSLGAKRTFANANELSFFVDTRLSGAQGVASGTWSIATNEGTSTGTFVVRMQYIGIGLAYSTSWGEPKLPRYMRTKR